MDAGDDLAEFLLARISEDSVIGFLASQEEERYGAIGNFTCDGITDPRLDLIRRFSTARLRLETMMHRQIIDLHRPVAHGCAGTDGLSPCPTLRLLALPFVDHPAYHQEWRP